MVPFRVFDRENKEMWIVLNYQTGAGNGTYLLAREDDTEADGEMKILKAEELSNLNLFLHNQTPARKILSGGLIFWAKLRPELKRKLLNGFFQFFARTEYRNLASRNRNFFAGLWVAAYACFAI